MFEFEFPQFGMLEAEVYRGNKTALIAKRIRELCRQTNAPIFDPFACADKLRIGVRLTPMPASYSGRLRFDLGYPVIELNDSENQQRRRFTLCHELAHLCFWETRPALPKERGDYSHCKAVDIREERICDAIASEVLMPATLFVKKVRSLPHSFDSVCLISRIFDVSILAVLRKFVDTPDSGWVVDMVTWQFDEQQSHLLRDRHRMRISRGKNRRRSDAEVVIKQSFETAARILASELKNCGSVNKYLSGNKYVTLPMDFPEVIAWHKRNTNQISAAVLF